MVCRWFLTYTVEFTSTNQRILDNLDEELSVKILSLLNRVSIRPLDYMNYFKRVIYGKSYYYRLVVDDYQIIVDVRDSNKMMIVVDISKVIVMIKTI